jgi:phage-related protein
MSGQDHLKELEWIGSSLDDLRSFPADVKRDVGAALYEAQKGGKPKAAKPLQGFGGAGVLEIIEDHRGDTYRAVYTVRFVTAIYVLHVFKKKSKQGIETPKPDIDKIRARLKIAEECHQRMVRGKER